MTTTKDKSLRNREIVAMRADGQKLCVIAETFGMTESGVAYVLRNSDTPTYLRQGPRERRIDLTGQQIGRLTVLGEAGRTYPQNGERFWLCRCACGNEVEIRQGSLRSGTSRSCGCLRSENFKWRGNRRNQNP